MRHEACSDSYREVHCVGVDTCVKRVVNLRVLIALASNSQVQRVHFCMLKKLVSSATVFACSVVVELR